MPEVELLVNDAVDNVLCRWPEKFHHRRRIMENMIDCLEHDSSWVMLYNASGELVIPRPLDVDEELGEIYSSVQEVC